MIRYRSLHSRGIAALVGSALVLGGATAALADQRTAVAQPAALTAPAHGDRLLVGERLDVGAKLRSRNGQYTLTVEASGAAALLTSSGGALWRTRAAGTGAYLTVKADGKVVLYNRKGVPVWYGPAVGRNAVLVVQDAGHLVEYVGGVARWWTTRKAYAPVLRMPAAAATTAPRPTASPTPSRTPVATPSPTPSPTPVATPSPTPSPTKAPAPSPTPSPTPAPAPPAQEAGARDAAVYPFASTSIWNTPIGSRAAFDGATSARTLSLNSGAKPVVNRDSWSVSVAAAVPQDTRVTLEAVRNKTSYTANIPAGTVATAGEDKHVTVIQPDRLLAYDTFKMEKVSNTHWEAQVAFPVDLRGTGMGTGTRAAGVPAVAGLIRAQELEQNSIKHALALAIPGEMLKPGPVWPASRQDSDISGYTGAVPMGTLFALPPSVDVSKLGLSPEGTALARALQDYGAYVVDRAGTVALYCELACDDDGYEKLREAWRVLHPQVRAVANSSASSVGGGGSPRVPLLADVG
ncbi:hypothetical protein [Cellulomonas sp. S1-8]|uniref:hypothetical protein n=1 Tax=Cellulomonas sp. S1-8 TaxID=2904790 RepID=UPI00224435F0|nr:hypothetical protein [Cellulomonas sp. S1-8]UZN04305.1 hypothetical protein OKX07_05060 [Cellulomonas sp. S1-8]